MNFGFNKYKVCYQLGRSRGLPVFAIDVGGVLASKQHDGAPMDSAFAALASLSKRYDLWVVSQCGATRAGNTEEWLADQGFNELLPPAQRIYVSFRENKTDPLRALNAKYFVDDRLKHCTPAQKVESLRAIYLFGTQSVWAPNVMGRIRVVANWGEVLLRVDDAEKEEALTNLRGAWEDGECPQQKEKT